MYSDTGSGGSIYNLASQSEDAVRRVARRYCTEHGLGQPTIGSRNKSPLGSDFSQYDFSCGSHDAPVAQQPNVAPQPMDQQPVTAQPAVALDVEKFGATCASIGFQKATPEYGNCVLKLMEMNSPQASQSAATSQQQLRQRQRDQAIQIMRRGLDGLAAPPPLGCEAPVTMTVRLPCNDVVSCTKKGDQVNCD